MSAPLTSARYRFGEGARAGLVLGLSMRQGLPIVIGMLWLTVALAVQAPAVGLMGPLVGVVFAFGRWRRSPLYEVAIPGVRLMWRRGRRRQVWRRVSLLAPGPGMEHEVPAELGGLELLETTDAHRAGSLAVVRDRRAATVSVVIPVVGEGFPVASDLEQESALAQWGSALSPLARAHCPVARVTWQEWSRPIGIAGHRSFLSDLGDREHATSATADYEALLVEQAPFTVGHDVLLTVTVELRRIRSRRHTPILDAAIDSLLEETRLLASRLEASGFTVGPPLGTGEMTSAVRLRSDPTRGAGPVRSSLASSIGRGSLEWGPMAVEGTWNEVRVDGSLHRSFYVGMWPLLPVGTDWLAPLLCGDSATRTVTMVLEPVPLNRAAQDANRQLTSIEADHQQKERHGFRLTARERRRQEDVETRERELAAGHPEFRYVAFVTVTAATVVELDDACALVEQAAAQAMLDLRPLAARQIDGWIASLPLGRSVRNGGWR